MCIPSQLQEIAGVTVTNTLTDLLTYAFVIND